MELTAEQKQEWENWLATRPQVIKELAQKFPPGEYIMKAGAPYGLSCAGTKVQMHSYHEDGTVSVVVLAEHKTAEGLEHESKLCEQYEKDKQEAHNANVKVNIDPVWMEMIN
jgi:hypothetical protein